MCLLIPVQPYSIAEKEDIVNHKLMSRMIFPMIQAMI